MIKVYKEEILKKDWLNLILNQEKFVPKTFKVLKLSLKLKS